MIAALPYRALPPCSNALFLLGGRRESFSFVTKREAEKSRYFRGAGHGLRALGFVLRTNASQARP